MTLHRTERAILEGAIAGLEREAVEHRERAQALNVRLLGVHGRPERKAVRRAYFAAIREAKAADHAAELLRSDLTAEGVW